MSKRGIMNTMATPFAILVLALANIAFGAEDAFGPFTFTTTLTEVTNTVTPPGGAAYTTTVPTNTVQTGIASYVSDGYTTATYYYIGDGGTILPYTTETRTAWVEITYPIESPPSTQAVVERTNAAEQTPPTRTWSSYSLSETTFTSTQIATQTGDGDTITLSNVRTLTETLVDATRIATATKTFTTDGACTTETDTFTVRSTWTLGGSESDVTAAPAFPAVTHGTHTVSEGCSKTKTDECTESTDGLEAQETSQSFNWSTWPVTPTSPVPWGTHTPSTLKTVKRGSTEVVAAESFSTMDGGLIPITETPAPAPPATTGGNAD